MDRDYIKLCAEMAYNEVIIEAVLNEEYLIEGFDLTAIKNRFRALVQGFINFCKNILDKIKKFISDKLKIINQKIKQTKNETKKNKGSIDWIYVYNNIDFYSGEKNSIQDSLGIFKDKVVNSIYKLTESYDKKVIEDIDTEFKKIINDESLNFTKFKESIHNQIDELCEKSKNMTKKEPDISDTQKIQLNDLETAIKSLESSIKVAGRNFELFIDKLNNIHKNNISNPFDSDKENDKKIKELEKIIVYKENVFKTIISGSMKKVNEASSYYTYAANHLEAIVNQII